MSLTLRTGSLPFRAPLHKVAAFVRATVLSPQGGSAMRQAKHFLNGSHRVHFALLVGCLLASHYAVSQNSFTKTYQLGGGIEVACCTNGPMSWGFYAGRSRHVALGKCPNHLGFSVGQRKHIGYRP